MKRMQRILLTALMPFALLVATAAEASSPEAYVRGITAELLNKLEEIQPLYESDQEAFFSEVDKSLGQHIDFEGFARGVMAKHYRRASEEQRTRFTESFRLALIRTYSKALVEFDNQKIDVLDPSQPQKAPDRASVALEVHAKDGTIYPVEYSMVLMGDEWKLRNVVINGINLGLQFKSQFSSYMQQYRNNIDLVIENWNVSEAV